MLPLAMQQSERLDAGLPFLVNASDQPMPCIKPCNDNGSSGVRCPVVLMCVTLFLEPNSTVARSEAVQLQYDNSKPIVVYLVLFRLLF